MNIPLYILVFLATVSLGINIGQHGEPRDATNGWISFFNYIISMALIIWAVWIGHL